MSVSSFITVENGLYVPFRGFDREVGPVGTLCVDAQVIGDGSGGTATINLQMRREEFGFHVIWIPTRVSVVDDLAAAEEVFFSFRASGNERLNADISEAVLSIRVANGLNMGSFTNLGVAVETASTTIISVMQAGWLTNTNLKVYHLHAYGILYDDEALARGKRSGKAPDQLMGGVR